MEKIVTAATDVSTGLDSVYIREAFDCLGVPDKDDIFKFPGMGSGPGTNNFKFASLEGKSEII